MGLLADPKLSQTFERLAQRQEREGDAILRLSTKLRLDTVNLSNRPTIGHPLWS
jgi:hypothetical protein